MADWARGPAGTNETSFTLSDRQPLDLLTAGSCESWERDGDTMIFHVRQGLHYALNPKSEASRLVGGREVVAEDFAFQLRRLWLSPTSYQTSTRPWKAYFVELDGGPSIKATDKYTFEMNCLLGRSYDIFRDVEQQWGAHGYVAPELIEKYGNVNDWKLAVGMGPFMLVDCIPGSTWTFERNPNYYMKDPVGPGKGNQLPYLDGVKLYEIYDASTRLAAMRTGKTDLINNIFWEDMDSLRRTTPELERIPYSAMRDLALYFRIDKPEIPLYDIRVRRALCLAYDNPTVRDTYYHGDADLISMPPEAPDCPYGITFDDYPREIQELYEYHPDKAKELLAEAGYPNGFKTSVLCQESQVDALSIVASYWKDVLNVDLELDVREYAVYRVIGQTKKEHKEMYVYDSSTTGWDAFTRHAPGGQQNYSMVNDPQINAAADEIVAAGWDMEKRYQIYKEKLAIRYHELVLTLDFPSGKFYNMWWPWLKNYHGEVEVGFRNFLAFTRFIWIDRDMKEAMVGIR